MGLKSINPYTNKTLEEFSEFDNKEIETRIDQANEAFHNWKRTNFEYRKKLMLKVAGELSETIPLLSKTISVEMGKPITESKLEIEKCGWVSEYYAKN